MAMLRLGMLLLYCFHNDNKKTYYSFVNEVKTELLYDLVIFNVM